MSYLKFSFYLRENHYLDKKKNKKTYISLEKTLLRGKPKNKKITNMKSLASVCWFMLLIQLSVVYTKMNSRITTTTGKTQYTV